MKFVILALIALSSGAFAQTVSVRGVEYGGLGCPQGSVSVQLAPDGSAFTILYDRFNVKVGADIEDALKNCSVVVHITKPRRLGFRVEGADFRGFVALDAGVAAAQQVKVMSGPNPGHRQLSAEFGTQEWRGPIADIYSFRAVRPRNNRPPVLDCLPPREDTDIVIESQVQVRGGGGSRIGEVSVDSADGRIMQKFSLSWIQCKNGPSGRPW